MKVSARVGLGRFAFGVGAIAAWGAAMVAAVQLQNPWVSVAAAVLFTVPLCSLGEWIVHGVLYHNRIDLTTMVALFPRLLRPADDPKGRNAANPSGFVWQKAERVLSGAETILADGRAACFDGG